MDHTVPQELDLDYRTTLISGGESGNYETVMWDRPRNTCFSMRFRWSDEITDKTVARLLRIQLRQQMAVHRFAGNRHPARRWSAT